MLEVSIWSWIYRFLLVFHILFGAVGVVFYLFIMLKKKEIKLTGKWVFGTY